MRSRKNLDGCANSYSPLLLPPPPPPPPQVIPAFLMPLYLHARTRACLVQPVLVLERAFMSKCHLSARTRRHGCAGDWKLWHGAIECGVMGSGIAVYLAARQVRLRCRKSSDSVSCTASEMDLECAGSSNANSKAGAPVRAAGWWRSGCVLCKRTLPSIGVMSAGLLLAAGPHVGHTLAPWRWPKQPTGAALAPLPPARFHLALLSSVSERDHSTRLAVDGHMWNRDGGGGRRG